jgi:hypothetical protein
MDLVVALKAFGTLLAGAGAWLLIAAVALELFVRLSRPAVGQREPPAAPSPASIRAAASGSRR